MRFQRVSDKDKKIMLFNLWVPLGLLRVHWAPKKVENEKWKMSAFVLRNAEVAEFPQRTHS